jgi:P pilus assembly chaperone PapD
MPEKYSIQLPKTAIKSKAFTTFHVNKENTDMNSKRIRNLQMVFAAFLMMTLWVGDALAAISFEKTSVVATRAQFEQGVEFPVMGMHGATTTFLSVRVFKWEQSDTDTTILAPNDDFTVYPQLVRMAPDSRVVVRIKTKRPLPQNGELHYRIVLEEFDRPDGTNAPEPANQAGISVKFRPKATLPMVVANGQDEQDAELKILDIRHEHLSDTSQKTVVRLRNDGTTLLRVTSFQIDAEPGINALIYVLPGSTVNVPWPRKLHSDAHLLVTYRVGMSMKDGHAKSIEIRVP